MYFEYVLFLLIGFICGGICFYGYGKKMALDLHEQYTKSKYMGMTCEEALNYERHGRHGEKG